MTIFEDKLKAYIALKKIDAEHLTFHESCHSVEEAAKAVGTTPDAFVKNICLVDPAGRLIVAILKGEDRLDLKTLGRELGGLALRMARADEVLEKTGYPAGGVPSFGYEAVFMIDERVMARDVVYSGGGSEYALVKISTQQLLNANNGRVAALSKKL